MINDDPDTEGDNDDRHLWMMLVILKDYFTLGSLDSMWKEKEVFGRLCN